MALDNQGHLAAGTSTGGTTGKRWGRVGDVPVIGAGTYASNRDGCAVSATGDGEYFIRATVARDICARTGSQSKWLRRSFKNTALNVDTGIIDGDICMTARPRPAFSRPVPRSPRPKALAAKAA